MYIIHHEMIRHLEEHVIMNDAQFSFRKWRLYETQLILTVNDLGKSIVKILLDFSKAFDKIPHQKLLLKLNHYCV